jgi:hypothetical protein
VLVVNAHWRYLEYIIITIITTLTYNNCIVMIILYASSLLPTYKFVVEDIGVEPMTPCVQGRCSSQLS